MEKRFERSTKSKLLSGFGRIYKKNRRFSLENETINEKKDK